MGTYKEDLEEEIRKMKDGFTFIQYFHTLESYLRERAVKQIRKVLLAEMYEMQSSLEGNLQVIYEELQNLAGKLEKANNGELPPSQQVEELAGRLTALEKAVATIRAQLF